MSFLEAKTPRPSSASAVLKSAECTPACRESSWRQQPVADAALQTGCLWRQPASCASYHFGNHFEKCISFRWNTGGDVKRIRAILFSSNEAMKKIACVMHLYCCATRQTFHVFAEQRLFIYFFLQQAVALQWLREPCLLLGNKKNECGLFHYQIDFFFFKSSSL